MNRPRLLLAALALLLSPLSLSAQPKSPIFAAERALADALQQRDLAGLDRLLAADYVLRSSPDIDRASWLRNAVTLCWGDRAEIGDFRERPIGDTIVASFVLTFFADPITCRPAIRRSLITDVWSSEADGWRLRVRHAAPPPNPDAGVAAQYGIVPEPPPTWDLGGELSFLATGGNTSTRTAGINSKLTHASERRTTSVSIAFISSRATGETNAQSLAVRGRHGRRLGTRMELFAEAGYARDRFAGIDRRLASSAGIGYAPRLTRPHVFRAEGSVGFTAERRVDATDLRFATAVGAAHYTWTARPGLQLTQDGEFTEDLQTLDNWRTTSATAVTVAMTRMLSLKASHVFEYRRAPVAGFRRLDLRTSVAVVISLQRRPTVR